MTGLKAKKKVTMVSRRKPASGKNNNVKRPSIK